VIFETFLANFGEHQVHKRADLGFDVVRQCFGQDCENTRLGSDHVNDQATAGRQDTLHLPQRGEFIRHELEPHLAQHNVEYLMR